MNERIKEIAEKCFTYSRIVNPGEPQLVTHEQVEKFAELLINESIEIMKQNDYHGEWLGEKIKEHFGVE